MCAHKTITYACGCVARLVEACTHAMKIKISHEDCQFHFSESTEIDEGECLSCVVRTTQRNQRKLESMKLEDFHVANLKFPPSPSPPPEDDEETPRQSFSLPPTPRETESRLPARESQLQRPVAEPHTVPLEAEVEPFKPKKLVRKMSEGIKKIARRLSKKE
ncbi:hypothetical protein BOTCAL_0226g00110 [Botryotinia calthae]|uniref:Uncharacterized protein n=1 Tax=Botryotinia calthae TaxID=38488 RepID=A0A4Y8D0G8_9HELO|nr:hypothetical protein BOTCAL_0226g00110 [Botryotinia calthae]